MTQRAYWMMWIVMTGAAAGYLSYALSVEQASAKRVLLPGETTHGHYQIELACNACHTDFMGVKQNACVDCHGDDLKRDKDTHPASKFNDPTNADRLAKLDAQQCTTCHREHVPDRTSTMGLSMPTDYCFHCHEDVADQRPSHMGMSHDSCQTAGCHNYHDNRALYEKFLFANADQPNVLDSPAVIPAKLSDRLSGRTKNEEVEVPKRLFVTDADAPLDLLLRPIVDEWAASAHATAGINCRSCHEAKSENDKSVEWQNEIDHQSCARCHNSEVESFTKGRHGMRLAQGMASMTPAMARLPMHDNSAHKELNCVACHGAHSHDMKFAAVEACTTCHNDQHTQNYFNSQHYQLWKEELAGNQPKGTGVSCATCHMPRIERDGQVTVQHNQNDNLRPNEKMIRTVCMDCHGLEFSLNSLADKELISGCFEGRPNVAIDSVQMTKRWFEEKERQKRRRNQN